MPLAAAIEQMLHAISPSDRVETVALAQALNRVTAADLTAPTDQPPFTNAAVDGYAVRLRDIQPDARYSIQATQLAGHPTITALASGQVVKIMTGAPMPVHADTVVMQEHTTTDANTVCFQQLPENGSNVRAQGQDVSQGALLVAAKTQLSAAHIALLASSGYADIPVYAKTRVGLLATGDELIAIGKALQAGEIYNSNGPALHALLQRMAVDIIDYGIVQDEPEALGAALSRADQECDFVISSGGVSVGQADYTKAVLCELGEIQFWKLAIKPGKPFTFGHLPASYFIGLPGNPVSAFVTFHILASQAIRQHQHLGHKPMARLLAETRSAINKKPGRMDFQRGRWQLENGKVVVSLTRAEQESHLLSSLSDANCYIALEQDRGNVSPGEPVTLWLFDELI